MIRSHVAKSQRRLRGDVPPRLHSKAGLAFNPLGLSGLFTRLQLFLCDGPRQESGRLVSEKAVVVTSPDRLGETNPLDAVRTALQHTKSEERLCTVKVRSKLLSAPEDDAEGVGWAYPGRHVLLLGSSSTTATPGKEEEGWQQVVALGEQPLNYRELVTHIFKALDKDAESLLVYLPSRPAPS